jgi:hypothetical protein
MMSYDRSDLSVILNVGKDPFSNRRMLFHQPPLFQGERAGFFKKPSGKADFADVVDEPA